MSSKVDILGVKVDSMTMAETVARIGEYLEAGEPQLIATANAEMIMRATGDKELKDILNQAAIVTPDGAGTVWAAHHLGYGMPERVAGYDLSQKLMEISLQKGWKFFFFGSAPGVAEKARKKAERTYPGIKVVGTRNGYFRQEEEPEILDEIRQAQPDILLAALGVPKQEKWLSKYKDELRVPISIGVGGTLDVMAGVMKRAPVWMQKARLEWLFRGALQPKRAGRLMALPRFVIEVHKSKHQKG